MQRIFDKTEKGREEIATRKYRLAPHLRTLLLLIDGKQTTDQLLQKIAGQEEQSSDELLNGEFMQDIADNAPTKQSDEPETSDIAPVTEAKEVPSFDNQFFFAPCPSTLPLPATAPVAGGVPAFPGFAIP